MTAHNSLSSDLLDHINKGFCCFYESVTSHLVVCADDGQSITISTLRRVNDRNVKLHRINRIALKSQAFLTVIVICLVIVLYVDKNHSRHGWIKRRNEVHLERTHERIVDWQGRCPRGNRLLLTDRAVLQVVDKAIRVVTSGGIIQTQPPELGRRAWKNTDCLLLR